MERDPPGAADLCAHFAQFTDQDDQPPYYDQERYQEAEPLFLQALAIYEHKLEPEHLNIAMSLNNLGRFYHDQKRYKEAEPLCQRALAIREQALGPQHPRTILVRETYIELLHAMHRDEEAAQLEKKAKAREE